MRGFFFLLSVLALLGAPVRAQEPVFPEPDQSRLSAAEASASILSEFRLGGFAHQFSSTFEDGTFDVNGELLFTKPITSSDPWIDALLPRPHVGATLNLGGKTSHVYAGLTWTVPLGEKLFVEGSFGASVNNGIDGTARRVHAVEDRSPVGCNLLFRESATIGFNINERWSVMGTWEHTSNAGMCVANTGLTNAGVRFGYKF